MGLSKINEIDPISTLYDDLKTILSGLVVKFSAKADALETLESKKYSDQYLDALQQRDTYALYEYTDAEYKAVGIIADASIGYYRENPHLLPEALQTKLLENHRKMLVDTYDEPNDYYRTLNGLPPKNTQAGVIVTKLLEEGFTIRSDTDTLLINDPASRFLSETSVSELMNTTMYHIGDMIHIVGVRFDEYRASNTRSFFIVPDTMEITTGMKAIYLRDAKTILFHMGIAYDDSIVGSYIYIPQAGLTDISNYNTDSYLVVSDDYDKNAYDADTMIYYSEALLNNENVKEGDCLMLGSYFFVSKYYEKTYGISTKVPIHKLKAYYGNQFMNILESSGYLNTLISENPSVEYLKYIGSKQISILTLRTARNFDILYMPRSSRDIVNTEFSICYNGSRDYFVNTVYNFYYRNIYDYYDNFIGIAIVQFALTQTIAKSLQTAVNRDFYDETLTRWLFDMYGVPYCAELPQQTQRRLTKNLNMLIQNKATNQVIYDIASLLGYHDFSVYKYYLVKERNMDSDENLEYFDTTTMSPTINQYGQFSIEKTTVNDLEKMYNVYFQKVNLKETNFQVALTDSSNKVDYDSVVQNDPLWWDDSETFDEVYGDNTKYSAEEEPSVYHKHYNFMETKYLGITISYKLSEVIYENIVLLRMIFDKKEEIKDLVTTLPKITGSMEVSLFDLIVFLCALISKNYHLNGEILTRYSVILDVMGYITEDVYGYKPCDTLLFNFERVTNTETFQEILKNPTRYLKENEVDTFMKYFSILTLPDGSTKEKIEAFNQMFANVKSLGYFLGRKMSESDNIYEYRAWRDLYNAIFIGQENNEMFKLGTEEKCATTYLEYLKVMNPSLYNVVANAEDYELYNYTDHAISRLEKIIHDVETLYVINDSTSSLLSYLIKLVKFFKSYTTDLLDVTTQYVFDMKPDNLFKLSEWYGIHQVILTKDQFKMMYSDTMKVIQTLEEIDHFHFEDYVYFKQKAYLKDAFSIRNYACNKCRERMNCSGYLCNVKKETCNGIYYISDVATPCFYFNYDTTELKVLIDSYRDSLLKIIAPYKNTIGIMDAYKNHLSQIYRMYYLITECNPAIAAFKYDLNDLEDRMLVSLDTLNTELSKVTSINIKDAGITMIIRSAKPYTVPDSDLPKKCVNPHYPCRKTDCSMKELEKAHYIETLYQADKILVDDMVECYQLYGMDEFLVQRDVMDKVIEILYNESHDTLPLTEDLSQTLVINMNTHGEYVDDVKTETVLVLSDSLSFTDHAYFKPEK